MKSRKELLLDLVLFLFAKTLVQRSRTQTIVLDGATDIGLLVSVQRLNGLLLGVGEFVAFRKIYAFHLSTQPSMEDTNNLASSHLLVYHTRNDAFSPPTRYELKQDRLLIFPEKGSPREVPLSQVKRCSLQYSPTRPEPNRYLCRLELQNGATTVFLNRTYKGIFDFQDTSAEYVAFVRALHQALFKCNPTCQFVGGVSPALYTLGILLLIFTGGVVVFVAIFLLVFELVWIVLLKLLILLYYTPAVIQWVKRNKPRLYDPLAIPSELLPEPAAR